MQFESFIVGYVFCMIADVVFSVANYYVQKAFKIRKDKKNG